jgi:hypothetical protein
MTRDYEVGFGKPPKAHRFEKGKSGNPKGRRPKEARSITGRQIRRDVLRALETEMDASVPGQRGKMTVAELIVWKQIEQALKGDHRSAKFLLELRAQFTEEHMRAHPDVMQALEAGERMHGNSESADDLNHHSAKVFNELRRLTQKV